MTTRQSERDTLLQLLPKEKGNTETVSSATSTTSILLSPPTPLYEDDDDDDHPSTTRNVLPKLVLMAFFLAMSMGSTLGIVPNIMTEQYAVWKYGMEKGECSSTATTGTTTLSESKSHLHCLQASQDAQTAAATSEAISNTLTLVCGSWIGSLSDVHGRKPFLLAGIVISLLPPLALLWTVLHSTTTTTTSTVVSPLLYYTAKSLNGLVHWMVLALSIVADVVVEKSQRAAGVGLLMAGFWLGLCLAPMVAVVVTTSQVQVVLLSCGLQLCGLVWAACCLPETLSMEAARHAREKTTQEQRIINDKHRQHNEQKHGYFFFFICLRSMTRPLRELSIVNRNALLRMLAVLAFFSGMATSGDQTLLLYYVDAVLHFDATDIAVMFLLVGGSAVIAQAVLLRPLNTCLGERRVLMVCFVAAALSNSLYGLARDKRHMYMAVCIGALSGMAFPTISAIKANNVEVSEQGRIQGALFSVQAVAAGMGPMAMRGVDATFGDWNVGSMFFFAALLQGIALCCACFLPKDKSDSSPLRRVALEER